jgi:hypothetical protein
LEYKYLLNDNLGDVKTKKKERKKEKKKERKERKT